MPGREARKQKLTKLLGIVNLGHILLLNPISLTGIKGYEADYQRPLRGHCNARFGA